VSFLIRKTYKLCRLDLERENCVVTSSRYWNPDLLGTVNFLGFH